MMQVQKIDKNVTFNAGLSKQIKTEISCCDVKLIENYFSKKGIDSNFKNNKIIAWCSLKCFELISEFNKRFKLNLGIPNGIFTEDFSKLRTQNQNALGLTNFAPTYLYKDKTVITPEKTIFFNSNDIKWNDIDSIADKCYENGILTTDFFLEHFFHEFMHVIHESNLINRLSGEKVISFLQKLNDLTTIENFQKNYAKSLSKICHYAASQPMEAIACDLSKRGLTNIDKENLTVNGNLFYSSPYNKKIFLTQIQDTKTNKVLRQIWNGKFEK